MQEVEFFFGLGSRYSYLAFAQIARIEARLGQRRQGRDQRQRAACHRPAGAAAMFRPAAGDAPGVGSCCMHSMNPIRTVRSSAAKARNRPRGVSYSSRKWLASSCANTRSATASYPPLPR